MYESNLSSTYVKNGVNYNPNDYLCVDCVGFLSQDFIALNEDIEIQNQTFAELIRFPQTGVFDVCDVLKKF